MRSSAPQSPNIAASPSASEQVDSPSLQQLCERQLIRLINLHNVLPLLQHRHLFSPRSQVVVKCELFVRDTFDVLVEQEGSEAVRSSLLPDYYEALEAEAEDRRRALCLITAARAGRVVERQQSASPERTSEPRQPVSPGNALRSPSQPLSPPGTPVTAAAAMASPAAAQKPVASVPLMVGSHPLAGPFSPSKPEPPGIGPHSGPASPEVSVDGAPGSPSPAAAYPEAVTAAGVDTGTPVKEVVEAEPVRAETPAASPGAPNRSPLQLSPTTGTALASPQALQASAAAAAATGKTSSAGQGDPLSAAVAAMAETPSKDPSQSATAKVAALGLSDAPAADSVRPLPLPSDAAPSAPAACDGVVAAGATTAIADSVGNGDGAGGEGAFFPYEALVEGREWPAAVDPSHRERHLNDEAFVAALGVSKDEFVKLPAWRQLNLKKRASLF